MLLSRADVDRRRVQALVLLGQLHPQLRVQPRICGRIVSLRHVLCDHDRAREIGADASNQLAQRSESARERHRDHHGEPTARAVMFDA